MNDLTLISSMQGLAKSDLLSRLEQLESCVRKESTQAQHRWALVEILCQLCQWERALQQLQAWARLQPDKQAHAHWVRGLIQAEHQRMQVFSGAMRAAAVVDFPEWMDSLARALEHNVRGEHALADACRTQALNQAPNFSGTCVWEARIHAREAAERKQLQVSWLADSDTRLGPVCELIVAGAYRWLAFAEIASLTLEPPNTALDLVWLPAKLVLQGSTEHAPAKSLHVYLPARSCWTVVPAQPTEVQQALMLGHLTEWHEVGETGVFSQGQKTWMTQEQDIPLLDVREVRS